MDLKNLEITYARGKGGGGKDAPEKIDLPEGDDGTNAQWTHFAQVLAGTAEPYPDGVAGRRAIAICEGSVISAREGKIVNVKDLG